MSWTYDQQVNPEGFGIFVTKAWTNNQGAAVDVTFFRGVPCQIESLSYADPFGDATAVIRFPQCTGFDSPTGDTWWLKEFANIDVWWVPCSTTPIGTGEQLVINPLTNRRDMYLHVSLAVPVWEGFIVSLEPSMDGVSVQCQGALYQLDHYYAKPLYPLRPKTVESMIERFFDPRRRGLWTQPLEVRWPSYWAKKYDAKAAAKFAKQGYRYVPTGITPGGQTMYDPLLATFTPIPDPRWTGYVTRNTGAWEKALTGYIQGQLSYLYARQEEASLYSAAITYADTTNFPSMYFEFTPASLITVGTEVTITGQGAPFDGIWTVANSWSGAFDVTMATNPGSYWNNGGGTVGWGGLAPTLFTKGDQWTITKEPGRKPVMYLREQARPVDYAVWFGQPGVDARLSRDGNQANNVVYGQGKGVDETSWSKQIFPNGNWSTYAPLSAKPEVWWGDEPHWAPTGNAFPLDDLYDGYWSDWERLHGVHVLERYITSFPDGIDLDDAEKISQAWLERDSDPGWSGSIVLQIDPEDMTGITHRTKWMIRAGDCILLRGFQGTGTSEVRGTNIFHISQVTMSPMQGTVELTVDSKFRDLLTVEEAIIAGRDSLSAIKALQVGKRSSMVNDLVMPWNNTAGSGYVPNQSKSMDRTSFSFPYSEDTTTAANQPINIYKPAYVSSEYGGTGTGKPIQGDTGSSGDFSHYVRLKETTLTGKKPFYIPVHAGASNRSARWGIVPVLLSQAGSIARTEFAVYDAYGNLAEVEFHVSAYEFMNIFINDMPRPINLPQVQGGDQHAALWEGAFESLDKTTNLEYGPTIKGHYGPPNFFKVGWGTYERPAGYSPGTKPSPAATSAMPTGKLIDGASWDYSFVGQWNFPPSGKYGTGTPIASSAVTGAVAVYIQIPSWLSAQRKRELQWVYVMGRFFRNVAIN
jgi:hypothetical protein